MAIGGCSALTSIAADSGESGPQVVAAPSSSSTLRSIPVAEQLQVRVDGCAISRTGNPEATIELTVPAELDPIRWVTVDIDFTSSNGVVLAQGSATFRDVQPGKTYRDQTVAIAAGDLSDGQCEITGVSAR